MSHAPSCAGAVYGCLDCSASRMTIEEIDWHRAICPKDRPRCRAKVVAGAFPSGRKIRTICSGIDGHDGEHTPSTTRKATP